MQWTEIDQKLAELAQGNEQYAEFNKRIVNTDKKVIGVRMPDLRKYARELARDMNSQKILQLLNNLAAKVYENTLFIGLLINYTKLADAEKLELTKHYLTKVDNWAEIDTFVETYRRKYDRDLWWDYSIECLKSDAEFVVRYGVINLMSNYLDDKYIDRALSELRTVKHDGYYVKMGLAWLYATAAIKYFDKVIDELESGKIDDWTRRKAYQKMIESYRITDEQKIKIRELRNKK